MKHSILPAVFLLAASCVMAEEQTAYVGADAKFLSSIVQNASKEKSQVGVRPFIGFGITETLGIEAFGEFSKGCKNVVGGSNLKLASFGAVVKLENQLFPEAKTHAFVGAGPMIFQVSCQDKNSRRIVPTAFVGLRQEFSPNLSARAYLDWKGTNQIKVESEKCGMQHTLKHGFGVGAGLVYSF